MRKPITISMEEKVIRMLERTKGNLPISRHIEGLVLSSQEYKKRIIPQITELRKLVKGLRRKK